MKHASYDEAREDGYRLKGIQLIDSVRQSLQLCVSASTPFQNHGKAVSLTSSARRPVKTFHTAAIYYHKFRVRFPSNEYNYEDVALAALFVACKAEDTIKKSKEILCAAHNLRQPHDHKTPDDKVGGFPLEEHRCIFGFRLRRLTLLKDIRGPVSVHRRFGAPHSRNNRLRLPSPVPSEAAYQDG
jgi:hypothetical protein